MIIDHDTTLNLTPVKRELSLAEKAYLIVEEMIVTLKLNPGMVFSEAELSRSIEIGRTPLREALQRLSNERLVSTLPRRGMIVSEINIKEQLTLLETRRVLERLIASSAARRASSQERELLRECALIMEKAAREKNTEKFMQHDREFDQITARASHNPFASNATAPLRTHCRRFWYFYQDGGDLTESAQLHSNIMESIAEGDEEKSAATVDELIDYLDNFTRAALDLY